ncbi:MAG: MerR family transcriptional regulator [Myxococcota bacterium]|nr:MerR family transcriptional regulator [Myxococcota bacterium]
MSQANTEALELTYPLRTAARLTGLSPELLRAWERRYGAVAPQRTPGGTRRYSAADLERLRLVKAAVDAGHRISQVAQLDDAALRRFAATPEAPPSDRLEAILSALDSLDAPEAQRLLALQLSALGPSGFAREVALPLVYEIGQRWTEDRMGIAPEHLATGVLRSQLGAALQPTSSSLLGPLVVFATPSGERHELGLLMAALTALGAGANPLYLGPEVPVDDLLDAVERSGAAALAVGLVTLPPAQAERTMRALRGGLPDGVHLWAGGAGAAALGHQSGVESFGTLEDLENRVQLLALETTGGA